MKIFVTHILLLVSLSFTLEGCEGLKARYAPLRAPSAPLFHLSGGSTTGPLQIRRMELVFSNNRGEMTVQRNERGLSARAIIQFSGNGPFEGMWEVDGRNVELVNLEVTFGNTLNLEMSPATVLPTFEPGLHQVTIKIQRPVPAFPIPTISYMVTANDAPAEGSSR